MDQTYRLRRGRRTSAGTISIAAKDRGIAIIGDGSLSIDQAAVQRAVGGQVFYEIKGAKISA